MSLGIQVWASSIDSSSHLKKTGDNYTKKKQFENFLCNIPIHCESINGS